MDYYGVCRRHRETGKEDYFLTDQNSWGSDASQSLKTDEVTAKSIVRSFSAADAAKKAKSEFAFDDFLHAEEGEE